MRGKACIPATAAAIAALAVGVTACGGGEVAVAPTVAPARTPKPLTREEVIARARDSVAQLVGQSELGGKQWGTLTMISPNTGVTNAHVVAGASQLQANFGAKGKSPAIVVGEDACRDLVFVRVTRPPAGVRAMPFAAPSEIKTGMEVMAAGYPASSGQGSKAFATITTGTVTADALHNVNLGSTIAQQPSMLSHSATINEGNSGGPLFNLEGQLLGINTYSLTSQDATYYTIRVDAVQQALPALQSGEKGFGLSLEPVRTWNIYALLRWAYPDVNPRWARAAATWVKGDGGMIVTGVAPGSEADRRHMKPGMWIRDMNNVRVQSATGACRTYEGLGKGDTLKLEGYHLVDGSLSSSLENAVTRRLHSAG
jgi:S1-C subfamily serine protease